MRLIDVRHLGRERVIGCWEVGEVLIDPGPESSLENLVQGLEGRGPRALLLTHIHLDHAGAAGAMVRRWPGLEVYVHESGAGHLADPGKLLASAERIYGDRMRELWGEVVPVPESNLRPLSGGETVYGFEVVYSPGHASHHVCFLHVESRRAFVGDVAGVRIEPCDLLLAPTPPPDIDVAAWEASLEAVEEWRPRSLAITHFGAVEDPEGHLKSLRAELLTAARLARELSSEEYERLLTERMATCDEASEAAYAQAMPPDHQWHGLHRYWEKREPED